MMADCSNIGKSAILNKMSNKERYINQILQKSKVNT